MKTYLLNVIQRVTQYSKQLDAEAVLYNKNWEVFNDSGEKEVFIFRTNNELLISRTGIVQKGKWELLSNNTLLIEVDGVLYLLNAAFVDSRFMALKLDGTNECMILIDSQLKQQLILESIDAINNYLEKINPRKNEVSEVAPEVEEEEILEEEDTEEEATTEEVANVKEDILFRNTVIIVLGIAFLFIIWMIANN